MPAHLSLCRAGAGQLIQWSNCFFVYVSALPCAVGGVWYWALAGLQAAEYAVHSLRVGGTTYLSAGGATADIVQREGAWKSDAYKGYVRSQGVGAQVVSNMLADVKNQPASQPSQRKERDIDG